MLLAACLAVPVLFLAAANGANDNFKGVATLYGSGAASYRLALAWATLTTLAGSLASLALAASLAGKFSGKGLVPDAVAAAPNFLAAVALGAAATVALAARLGFPVSTTHALVGALCGSGRLAAGPDLRLGALGKSFLLPLLASPLLAAGAGFAIYLLLHALRVRAGVDKSWCLCVGQGRTLVPIPRPGSALALSGIRVLEPAAGTFESCSQRYDGRFAGLGAQQAADGLHWLSAGSVGFARGLNDAPKIVALLLALKALPALPALALVASAMAAGGVLGARRVAETMSRRITPMTPGQGLSANLATSLLVIWASRWGLPVSTTHVSVGALFGIGLLTGKADHSVVRSILASWLVTLPAAAALSALAYRLLA